MKPGVESGQGHGKQLNHVSYSKADGVVGFFLSGSVSDSILSVWKRPIDWPQPLPSLPHACLRPRGLGGRL